MEPFRYAALRPLYLKRIGSMQRLDQLLDFFIRTRQFPEGSARSGSGGRQAHQFRVFSLQAVCLILVGLSHATKKAPERQSPPTPQPT
jgi:hypothetical protein